MSEKVTLLSGNFLELDYVSFRLSQELLQVLTSELKKIDIDIDKLDLKSLASKKLDGKTITTLKNLLFGILGSKELDDVLLKCFAKCIYNNNQKVTEDLFETNISARADYYNICWEVIRFNLSPFFRSLNLGSFISKIQKNTPIQK